jgi:hypothetical protein
MTSPSDPHAPSADHYHTSFSPETRKELGEEDSQAWNAIVSLLLGIICTGVLLAVMCVLLTTRYMT